MSIKIDLANQVRQTVLPKWKPLLPLFEAVMNSIQAIRDVGRADGVVKIIVKRETQLFAENDPPIVGFVVDDNGVGLDDQNFDSFNTAFSRRKQTIGGKGLGRFTWLKAFDHAKIRSTFKDNDGAFLTRSFIFDEQYDLDKRGLPTAGSGLADHLLGTTVELIGLRQEYKEQVPRSIDVLIQKLIEHFILVLLEPTCPTIRVEDQGVQHEINEIFVQEYRSSASSSKFSIAAAEFTVHGFRLPTSRTTKHKLVYAADQRAVTSDKLEEFIPNLSSRLEDENGRPFFYLAIVQSPYLSDHVTLNRTDFDFSIEDGDQEPELLPSPLIPRSAIREKVIEFVASDLQASIDSINSAKLERIRRYVHQEAPQYRILLKYAAEFIGKLPASPSKGDIEAALHRELHTREVELRKESTRIFKEADKLDNYEEYHRRLSSFIDQYNELGVSALAQYVAHRKIILEFLERAIQMPEEATRYPLEEVVHKLVFPMHTTSEDIPYHEQNLWMIDERLTYHSFVASDKQLRSVGMLKTRSQQRGDIVIFDEKIIFADVDPAEHPINSITTIEFKRPGRDDYTATDNPLAQAFTLVEEIRNAEFRIKGRPVSVANQNIPAHIYCICDITQSMRQVLRFSDAFETPDKQGFYGFHRGFNAYYEVIDYNKMLRDAKKRNRAFFEKLNFADSEPVRAEPPKN